MALRHGLVAVAGALVVLAALVVGCSKRGTGRLPVYGTVSAAKGEPLSGSIAFVPSAGRPGPSATANLVAGAYRFDRSDGPTAGPHRVTVIKRISKEAVLKSRARANRSAAREDAAAEPAKTVWTLSADVPADPPYRCDFRLPP